MNAREDQVELTDEEKLRARIEALTGGRRVIELSTFADLTQHF